MIRITKRRVAWFAFGVLVLASVVYLVRAASILAAYKAKMLCSEVFLAGREADVVERELEVDDLAPLRYIAKSVNRGDRRVTARVAGVIRQDATYRDSRGCAVRVESDTAVDSVRHLERRPAASADVSPDPRLGAVLDRAFAEQNQERPRRTRAVVVVRDGRIVAERYAPGFTKDTPILGWSMTKTMINALVGILVKEGRLAVDRPAPIPEWQDAGDPRRAITLDHLLRMSSGLEFDESPWNPVSDVTVMLLGRPDAGLYVNDGVWEEERILPEGWVTYTRSPAPADPLTRYGAHVWLKVADEYSGNAVLPADAFHATGHAGQFVTMIPSARLVVVRLGLTRYPHAWDQTAFVRDVLDAIGGMQ